RNLDVLWLDGRFFNVFDYAFDVGDLDIVNLTVHSRLYACFMGFAVDEVRDDRGGWGDAHRQDLLAEQRVDHRGLAVIELAEHHEGDPTLVERGDSVLHDLLFQGVEV